MISHTARLISISVAHSLLQFKSANGGLQCLCSAAYTWHQIYPLGTHYCLQKSTHPFQNRPRSIVVFPGPARVYAMPHLLSIKYKDMLLLLRPVQWLQMVICCKQEPPILLLHCTEEPSSKQLPPRLHCSHFWALRNAHLYTADFAPTADR